MYEKQLFQLWDIRAGRELHEFVEHSGPVTAVEFHPHEFLLTSASTDKTVNFYDLESFSLVSTSDRETMSIRSVFNNSERDAQDSFFSSSLNILKQVVTWFYRNMGNCQTIVLSGFFNIFKFHSFHHIKFQIHFVKVVIIVLTPIKYFSN